MTDTTPGPIGSDDSPAAQRPDEQADELTRLRVSAGQVDLAPPRGHWIFNVGRTGRVEDPVVADYVRPMAWALHVVQGIGASITLPPDVAGGAPVLRSWARHLAGLGSVVNDIVQPAAYADIAQVRSQGYAFGFRRHATVGSAALSLVQEVWARFGNALDEAAGPASAALAESRAAARAGNAPVEVYARAAELLLAKHGPLVRLAAARGADLDRDLWAELAYVRRLAAHPGATAFPPDGKPFDDSAAQINGIPLKVAGSTAAASALGPAAVPQIAKPTATAAVADQSDDDLSRPDGPEGSCRVWWRGEPHAVPKGVLHGLVAYFWKRDSASYAALMRDVFDGPQEARSIGKRLSEANGHLKRIGVPWRLSADARSETASKRPA